MPVVFQSPNFIEITSSMQCFMVCVYLKRLAYNVPQTKYYIWTQTMCVDILELHSKTHLLATQPDVWIVLKVFDFSIEDVLLR